MLRRLVFLLVCLGLALQGGAVFAVPKAPCPMEAAMQAMQSAGTADPAELPECCTDAQTFAQTGQSCKAGSDCNAPTAISPPVAASDAGAVLPAPVPLTRAAAALAAPSATPWRPPARH